jgi:hypothetical protein
MALQSSGQISLSNIASEKGVSLSNVSLNTLSTTSINQNSAAYPDGSQPHSVYLNFMDTTTMHHHQLVYRQLFYQAHLRV